MIDTREENKESQVPVYRWLICHKMSKEPQVTKELFRSKEHVKKIYTHHFAIMPIEDSREWRSKNVECSENAPGFSEGTDGRGGVHSKGISANPRQLSFFTYNA